MIDEPDNLEPPPEDPAKAYGDLLGNGSWDVDLPDMPAAPDVSEPDAPSEGPLSPSPLGGEGRREGLSTAETPTAPPPAERIIEALLFVGGPPLHAVRAAEI